MRVGYIHEPHTRVDVTKIPTERQTQTLQRHSTEEMKRKLQTTQQRMMTIIILTKRKTGTVHAAAHAAGVNDTVDVEVHDPDSEP